MPCPPEPTRISDVNELRPDFWLKAQRWLAAIKNQMQLDIGIHETYRSQERQNWLYQQGRVEGCGTMGRFVTWTKDSNHLYRIALDFHFRKNGKAIWDVPLYEKALKLVPPVGYGLESLAPTEFVHVQLLNADSNRTDWQPNQTTEPPKQVLRVFIPGITEQVGEGTLIGDKVYLSKLGELKK